MGLGSFLFLKSTWLNPGQLPVQADHHVGQVARRIHLAKLSTGGAQSGVEEGQLAVVHTGEEVVEQVVPKGGEDQGKVRLVYVSAKIYIETCS